MLLSKESRNLGQKAAAISATAFALKSLGVGTDKTEAPTFFAIAGAENAAAVAAIASITVTIYFLVRVADEQLAASYKILVRKGAPATRELIKDGDELDANIFLQGVVKSLISFADFWIPVVLGGAVAGLLWADIANLVRRWLSLG